MQTGYSVVSACVVTLRWKDKAPSQVSSRWTSAWQEGVICLIIVACCGFGAGLFYRYGASIVFLVVAVVIAVLAAAALYLRQVSIMFYSMSPISSHWLQSCVLKSVIGASNRGN